MSFLDQESGSHGQKTSTGGQTIPGHMSPLLMKHFLEMLEDKMKKGGEDGLRGIKPKEGKLLFSDIHKTLDKLSKDKTVPESEFIGVLDKFDKGQMRENVDLY
jgi:hypothetical protein